MILLNGLAPIMGATFLHLVFINIFAILVEHAIIGRGFPGSKLMLRVVLANLISVIAGTIVIYTIPELIGGAVGRPDSYEYTDHDRFAMGVGLTCLFLSNVLIETPAYLVAGRVGKENVMRLISLILIANLVSNIPVVLIYMVFVS